MNKNLKKVTVKDRYGNSVALEMHDYMQGMTAAKVPPMQDIPTYDHQEIQRELTLFLHG